MYVFTEITPEQCEVWCSFQEQVYRDTEPESILNTINVSIDLFY